MCQFNADLPQAVESADVVGDVNQHTHGTEFYGTSSNFVLLNQFFMYARRHQPNIRSESVDNAESVHLSVLGNGAATRTQSGPGGVTTRTPLSIVNLLADEEVLDPPSRPKTPITEVNESQTTFEYRALGTNPFRSYRNGTSQVHAGPTSGQVRTTNNDDRNSSTYSHHSRRTARETETLLQTTQQRLEREFVRQFMDNLHNLHPMLDPIAFTARCEEQVWHAKASPEKNNNQRHFFALYNIVVAVGALVSGSTLAQSFEQDINMCVKHALQDQSPNVTSSSQELSKVYFRKCRALLRNVFEVCSLESAQTLLLIVCTMLQP